MFTFRDPSGSVFLEKDVVYRGLIESQSSRFLDLSQTLFYQELNSKRMIPKTDVIAKPQLHCQYFEEKNYSFFLKHEKIPFPSYAYEWSPQMLYKAGEFTLDLLENSLAHDYILKDATPYNILFRNSEPVFVDLLSFEKYQGWSTWSAYNQFCQTFLLPLLVNKYTKQSLASLFYTKRDGITPEDAIRSIKGLAKLNPQVFFYALLPHCFSSFAENKPIYAKTAKSVPLKKAKFTLDFLINGLRKNFGKLKPLSRKSTWSSYMEKHACSYSSDDFHTKEKLVKDLLQKTNPKKVLDIGCNSGHFSKLAAEAGADVVAIDFDEQVIDKLFLESSTQNLSILPLQVDLARPSPALGWNNMETLPFIKRAEKHFDLVLMLAVIHHLIVQERIPLEEIVRLLTKITKQYVVIEFVSKEDRMFKKIARGRESLHENHHEHNFEKALASAFSIEEKHSLNGSLRILYLLKKK